MNLPDLCQELKKQVEVPKHDTSSFASYKNYHKLKQAVKLHDPVKIELALYQMPVSFRMHSLRFQREEISF